MSFLIAKLIENLPARRREFGVKIFVISLLY